MESFDRLSHRCVYRRSSEEATQRFSVCKRLRWTHGAYSQIKSKSEWKRKMKSLSTFWHHRPNHHQRHLTIVQWHGAVLAVVKTDKRKTTLRRKGRKSKNVHYSYSYLTFSDNESQCTTLEEISESKSSDCDVGNKHRSKRDGDCFQVFHNVNTLCSWTVNYSTYRLKWKLSKYAHTVSENICRMSKRMMAKMKSHTFVHIYPILIIRILCNFKSAYNTKGIHEEAEMLLFHFFLKK